MGQIRVRTKPFRPIARIDVTRIPAWFNPGWQPQVQLGDGKAPKAASPSPNPLDLRLPHAMEPQSNVTRDMTYLNQARIPAITSVICGRACGRGSLRISRLFGRSRRCRTSRVGLSVYGCQFAISLVKSSNEDRKSKIAQGVSI